MKSIRLTVAGGNASTFEDKGLVRIWAFDEAIGKGTVLKVVTGGIGAVTGGFAVGQETSADDDIALVGWKL